MPFYACATNPDLSARTGEDVEIEERDPAEVLKIRGVRTAATGALGRYPAFDCTPPDLVTGLITPRGVIAPYDIRSVFGAA